MNAIKEFRRKHGLNRSALLDRFQKGLLFFLTPDWKLHWKYVLHYQSRHKEFCLLLKPRTFNQKIFYKLIYDRRPLLITFTDKLQAREYVSRKIGRDVLVPLLAVASRPEEIKFEELPQRFVLKANHGSGYVRIVKNKFLEDESELREICQQWLSKNYGELTGEWAYKTIPPKIMIESFLDAGTGEVAYDYKLFVFNGKVFMIEVDMDRYTDHRRNFFTPDWKWLNVRYRVPNAIKPVPRPVCLEKMVEMAECLGQETDFVRVDLYEVNGRIYFGELTNYPLGGGTKFDPMNFDAVLGAQWRIEGY